MSPALPRPTRLAYEWYALAASGMHEQRAAAADERISWRPRGDAVQRCALGIRNYARGLVGHSELGRRRRLRPCGGICVLQTCSADALVQLFLFSVSCCEFGSHHPVIDCMN